MYYWALSLGVLQHILPRFLVTCAIWCVLEYSFIDMALLRTSYMYGGVLEYYLVRFGVCIIKLCHERMLILRWIPPLKN